MDATQVASLRALYEAHYKQEFNLDDSTIRDIVKSIPDTLDQQSRDDFVLREMRDRSMLLKTAFIR